MLEQRFNSYKLSFKSLQYGSYWEKAKKTFDVDFKDGEFISKGERNYLPTIYDEKINENDLKDLKGIKNKFFEIGSKKLCLTKNNRNSSIICGYNYYNHISEIIIKKDIICEVGTGSGFLSCLINDRKNTINILVDIPEVLLNAISLAFTIFPNKKFVLPNEINKDTIINDYDFIFLEPSQINIIPDKFLDLAINTESFMEMDMKEVDEYLSFFSVKIKDKGHIFIANRLRKRHYFFNYNFHLIDQIKKIKLFRDNLFYNTKGFTTMMIIIFQKDLKITKKFDFNFFHKLNGITFFKFEEFIFWLKKDIVSILKLLRLR